MAVLVASPLVAQPQARRMPVQKVPAMQKPLPVMLRPLRELHPQVVVVVSPLVPVAPPKRVIIPQRIAPPVLPLPPVLGPFVVPESVPTLRIVSPFAAVPPPQARAAPPPPVAASEVGIIATGGTSLSMVPADLTAGPRTDITEFSIIALDAGTY
jgi:hypothetical protein